MYPEHLKKYIPPNFDLAKYENAKNMDLENWFRNLMFRQLITAKEGDDYFLNIHLEHGAFLSPAMTDEQIIELYPDGADQYGPNSLAVVRNVLLKEVMWVANDINLRADHQKFIDLYNYCEEATADDEDRSSQLNNYLALEDKNGSDDVWLSVDFSCSDSEIQQAFDFWLKKTRKRLDNVNVHSKKRREPKTNQFNSVTRGKWYKNKVLPYLDLANWNHLQGNNVTSAILGEILFPDNMGSTATIDDTVKPLASKLTSTDVTKRMMAVVYELNRQKIDKLSS